MIYERITHSLIKKAYNNCHHRYDIDNIVNCNTPSYDCSLDIYYNITDDIIEDEYDAFGMNSKHYDEKIKNTDYLLLTTVYGCDIYDEIYRRCKKENFKNDGEPEDGDDLWFLNNTHYWDVIYRECNEGEQKLKKLYQLVDKYDEIQNK